MSGPTLGVVLGKACLELVGMGLLLLPMAYIYVFTAHFEPFHRGFFCDDQDLKHPYKEQTVPILAALLTWLGLAVFIILLVESLRSHGLRGKRRSSPIPDSSYPPWLAVELYRYFGFFALGAGGCLLFTELAKYSIGRLRPHFLTLCSPDYSQEGLCRDPQARQYHRYVLEPQDSICLGLVKGTVTLDQLHEARLSFLSGHASFSFYCATYLIVYLQARLTNFPTDTPSRVVLTIYWLIKVFRPFLQFGMFSLAFWISLTRISDYFHHPYDVVTGSLVGIGFGATTLLVMADVFNKKSAFWKSLGHESGVLEETKRLHSLEMASGQTTIPYIDETEEQETVKTRVF